MRHSLLLTFLALLAAILIDCVVGPILLGGRIGLHFTAGVVILAGMRKGWLWGLGAGWAAGAMAAALSSEPQWMSMLTLGLAGAGGGLLVNAAALRLPWLDGIILLAMLLIESMLANAMVWLLSGVPFRTAWLGCTITAAMLIWITGLRWRARPAAPSAPTQQTTGE